MEIVLGPPGTGKTTYLLRLVEQELTKGTAPDRIGYMAFTRRAAEEARGRAMQLFQLTADDLPYFRTLHSAAFRELGYSKTQVMQNNHYRALSESLGLPFTGQISNSDPDIIVSAAEGDRLLFLVNRARVMMRDLRDLYDDDSDNLSFERVEWLARALSEYKEANTLKDFNDMIAEFVSHGVPPELDLLVVDEAQDLSRLQWKMVERLAANSRRTVVAGDDDQGIFRWAGADVDHFLNLQGSRKVLGQSYRVPAAVQRLAFNIISRVERRNEKQWQPRPEEGETMELSDISEVDLGQSTHLILTRNSYLLNSVEAELRREGYFYQRNNQPSVSLELINTIQDWETLRANRPLTQKQTLRVYSLLKQIEPKHRALPGTREEQTFTWSQLNKEHGLRTRAIWHEALDKIPAEDRSYLVAARRRNEKFLQKPRISLSTIHGSKGGEADEVTVFTDMAKRTHSEFFRDPDDEHRVFYVAVTRARRRVNIVRPRTLCHFPVVF